MSTIGGQLGFLNRLKLAFGVVKRGGIAQLVQQIKMNRSQGVGDGPTNAYSEVVVVYAAVKVKANSVASMPMMISTIADQVLESGPLVELTEQPNPGMTGDKFVQATSAMLDLFGKVMWVFVLDAGGRPTEVYPVSPLQIKPIRNRQTGELLGWEYLPAGARPGMEQRLSPEEVHVIIDENWDDADPLSAISPRHAARRAISQYYKADWANEASLDNGVEPGGALVAPADANLTIDQRNDIREQIDQRHTGVKNRRRWMLLEGGLTWQQIMANFGDMEFTELKKMAREDTCAAYGVPPAVLGWFADSNYAHADAARQSFWIETILPLASRIAKEWDIAVNCRFEGDRSIRMADAKRRALSDDERVSMGRRSACKRAAKRGRRFYTWFDSSQIAIVQMARLATVDTVVKWWNVGVPLNPLIRAVDAPVEEVPWGNTWWKDFGKVDVQEEAGLPGMDDPPGSEDPNDPDNVEASMRALPGAAQLPGVAPDEPRNEHARARLWLQWRQSWAGLERAMKSKTRKHFNGLRSETLERLAATIGEGGRSISGGDRRRDLIGEILFDIIAANEKLLKVVGPIFRDSYRLGGEQVASEAPESDEGEGPTFNMADPNVSAALRRREIQITGLNRTLSRRLRQRIDDGLTEGATLDQLKDTIREEFNIAGRRAATIARTEVGAAVEEARAIGMRQAGVPLKSWLSSRKETGRPSHLATELETMRSPVPRDQDFRIGTTGVTCPHPRATGRPEHDVNCTCTSVARFEGDSVRSVLERYMRRGFLTYEQLKARDGSRADDRDD